ncbi:hypothetical protein EKO23_24750, partial [Nocardioides guangzhouensis]
MPDLDRLRDLADQVRPPALEALRDTARRRDRRAAATLVAGCVTVLVVVLGGVLLDHGDERSRPQPVRPGPSPSGDVRALSGTGEVK